MSDCLISMFFRDSLSSTLSINFTSLCLNFIFRKHGEINSLFFRGFVGIKWYDARNTFRTMHRALPQKMMDIIVIAVFGVNLLSDGFKNALCFLSIRCMYLLLALNSLLSNFFYKTNSKKQYPQSALWRRCSLSSWVHSFQNVSFRTLSISAHCIAHPP